MIRAAVIVVALLLVSSTARAECTPDSQIGCDIKFVTGLSMLGVGSAGMVLFGVAASRVQQIEDDPGYLAYRQGVPRGQSVCAYADRGTPSAVAGATPPLKIRSLCSDASTWSTVSYAALPFGVIGLIGGTLLVLASDEVAVIATGTGASVVGRF